MSKRFECDNYFQIDVLKKSPKSNQFSLNKVFLLTSSDCPIYDNKFPFSDLKPSICQYVNSLFQDKWNNCCANKLHEINGTFSSTLQIYSDSRKDDVKLTRLRIGHTRLTHKHFLLNEDSPECIPCNCPLTVKHILLECIDTADIRRQYFNFPDLKTLFNSVAGDTILAFLSDIHLVDKI